MKTWYIHFRNPSGIPTTIRVEAPKAVAALFQATEYYMQINRYSRETAEAHVEEVGIHGGVDLSPRG